MHLDTYRSTRVEGVFVTLPSNERSVLRIVDELSALGLDPVRCEYEIAGDGDSAAFAHYVFTQIVLKGYATHGREGSPLAVPPAQ
jgi:hypothetical protein